ncbi:MAG: 2-oxoacid:ferredoxin oxidoreductase subunit beta [Elusimicrobia bacterium]|nr:2-oxoacid:ferredoxin oxidoreductase subunit beta [Elusimicrobiota bacterium]
MPASITEAQFRSETKPDWCPSCGDFAVLSGLIKGLTQTGIAPKDVAVVSGIGCSSNLPGFIRTYGFHSLHGRSIPVATGVKLANPNLHVVVTGGDGDGYGIGIGHFIHAMRRNLNITYIVMNNEVYGLTTGQISPTSEKGHVTKTTPQGSLEEPINPVVLAIAAGATFVARAFSGDPNHMAKIIGQGISHKGFSLIDVFSPCVTFNKLNTYDYFRKRVFKLEDESHDPANFNSAMEKASMGNEKIPLGVLWKTERPTLDAEKLKGSTFPAEWNGSSGLTDQQFESLLAELK